MKTFRVSENIVPVSEFKAQAAEMLKRLAGSGEPLVITQNGKAAGVLLSPEAYDELTERGRFVDAVLEGTEDARTGRLVPHKEVRRSLASGETSDRP
ncbi:MAG: type II toxin-antitoxin system Phd/YefM family antitoxin [Acidobacteriota bacterium]